VREVLDYVEFDANALVFKLRSDVESAVREGRMTFEEARHLIEFYEDGLRGYTYLEDPREK
jgi:arginine decarboxylase